MIAGWAFCLLLTAVLLAAAGWAGERAAAARGRPRRWPWALALAGVLVLPPLLLVAMQTVAGTGLTVAPVELGPAGGGTAAGSGGAPAAHGTAAGGWSLTAWLEASSPWVGGAWAAWSAAALGRIGWTWHRTTAAGEPCGRARGVELRRTEETGPAVAGWSRPRILLPDWYFELDDRERELVLTHEREHVSAGDHRLLWAAGVVVALMPWNLPLRWMAGRLREAVELDCDRRTVPDEGSRVQYGHLLLEACRRRIRPGPVGWGGSASTARRIRALTGERGGGRHAPALAAAGVAFSLLASGAVTGGMYSSGYLGAPLPALPEVGSAPGSSGDVPAVYCGNQSSPPAAPARTRLTVHRGPDAAQTTLRIFGPTDRDSLRIGVGDGRLEAPPLGVGLALESTTRELACTATSVTWVEAGIRADDRVDLVDVRAAGGSPLLLVDASSGQEVLIGTEDGAELPTTCVVTPDGSLACGESVGVRAEG